MKYRVERERTDNGYGPGWVIMTATGVVVAVESTWAEALAWALWFTRWRPLRPWYSA